VAFCLSGMKCLVMEEKASWKKEKTCFSDFLFLKIVKSCAKPPEFSQYSFYVWFVTVYLSHAAFCWEPSDVHARGTVCILKTVLSMTPKTIAVAHSFRSCS